MATTTPAPKSWHKILLKFNFGDQGWFETYYANNAPADPVFHDNYKALATARVKLLAGKEREDGNGISRIWPQLVAITVANIDTQRQSEPYYPDATLAALNEGNTLTTKPAVAFSLACSDEEKFYRRIAWLRCLPENFVPFEAAYDEAANIDTLPAQFTDALTEFRRCLRNVDAAGNPKQGPRFGVLVDNKRDKAVRHAITLITKTASRHFWVKVPGVTYGKGTLVTVGGVTGRHGVQGVNGDHEVIDVDPVNSAYLLSEPSCDPCPPAPFNLGHVYQRKLDLPQFAEANPWLWSERALGKAFFTRAGRQSAKQS